MPRGKHIRTVGPRPLGPADQPEQRRDLRQRARGSSATAPTPSRRWAPRRSKGTKIFSLTGKVRERRPHRGAHGRHPARRSSSTSAAACCPAASSRPCSSAVRPAAACRPTLLDQPIDFESLVAAGSMMGSGGMVVVDDATCMVDFAKFFLKFTAEESCGKCVPCRVGTTAHARDPRAHLRRPGPGRRRRAARGSSRDDIIEGSLCAARRQRPQPGPDHAALLPGRGHGARGREALPGRRSAGRSSATASTRRPAPAATPASGPARRRPISGERKQVHVIDQKLCIKCDACRQVCRFDAVRVVDAAVLALAEGRRG